MKSILNVYSAIVLPLLFTLVNVDKNAVMSIDKLYFIVKFHLHSICQYLRYKAISVLDSKLYQSNKN